VTVLLLFGYLDFTLRLEASYIGPICRDLALGRVQGQYGRDLVCDALRVECDEAFHALLSEKLAIHVSQVTGVPRPEFPEHFYFRRVRDLRRLVPTMTEEQFNFCVGVVSETVITRSLLEDWRDGALRPEVRNLLHHHYRDEARHSVFFTEALRVIWPQWSRDVHAAMCPVWAELVSAFLRADSVVAHTVLRAAGLGEADANRIVSESHEQEGKHPERSASYALTLAALGKVGALPATAPAPRFGTATFIAPQGEA